MRTRFQPKKATDLATNPNGIVASTLGFFATPTGPTVNPTGFVTNPAGILVNPVRLTAIPNGFVAFPLGFIVTPIGFIVIPTGFATIPEQFFVPFESNEASSQADNPLAQWRGGSVWRTAPVRLRLARFSSSPAAGSSSAGGLEGWFNFSPSAFLDFSVGVGPRAVGFFIILPAIL